MSQTVALLVAPDVDANTATTAAPSPAAKMAPGKAFRGQHVLITGGSTGIGLALAKEFLKRGACLTLLARTVSKLEAAVKELEQLAQEQVAKLSGKAGGAVRQAPQQVRYQAADVTQPEQVQAAVRAAEEVLGPVDVLVCNAGIATPGYFHEQALEVFEKTMRLNYFGALHSVRAVYEGMVARNSGHICVITSTMAQMGFVGYSSYAPTKYALKGLADCLRSELQGTKVRVSIAYPPDTDTPGYKQENLTKPKETAEISTISSVFKPEQVAGWIVGGIANKRYTLYTPDIGLNLHVHMMQGLVPQGFFSLLAAVLVGWIAPVVQAIHGVLFDRISRKAAPARFAKVRAEYKGTGGGGGTGGAAVGGAGSSST